MWKGPREGRSSILTILDLRDGNYRLAVLNGWLVWLGDTFLNPNIVLTSFAAKLGAPGALIGLLPALLQAGGMIPQAFFSLLRGPLSPEDPPLPEGGRPKAFWGDPHGLGGLLPGPMATASLCRLPNGPSHQRPFHRGFQPSLLGGGGQDHTPGAPGPPLLRPQPGGGLLAFLAGFGVREILALPLPFPLPYALLFALGALAFGLGWYLFGLTEEPEEPPREERLSLSLPLQHGGFRRYLWVRVLLGLAAMAEPFYAVYAVRALGQGKELGVYLSLYALSFTLSNLLWAKLAKRGSKGVLQAGAFLAFLTPLLALFLPSHLFRLSLSPPRRLPGGLGACHHHLPFEPSSARRKGSLHWPRQHRGRGLCLLHGTGRLALRQLGVFHPFPPGRLLLRLGPLRGKKVTSGRVIPPQPGPRRSSKGL